jgi:hypothetical protein
MPGMQLVIKPHRPLRKVLIGIALAVAGLLSAAIAFDYGHWQHILAGSDSTELQRALREELQQLREENEELRYALTRLQRAAEIDTVSRRDNHRELVAMQKEAADLKRELAFFREVMGATEVESRTQVKGVQVRSLGTRGHFGYRLVLTHVDKDDKTAEGRLRIALSGTLRGQKKALGFAELNEAGPAELSFKFKHFRLIEGTLKLPEGFVPRLLTVDLYNTTPTRGTVSETYDWAAVLN